MSILYLIDASNWAHRSYHSGTSLPTMLRSFYDRAGDPENVVAALDHPTAPTWRQELYLNFKGGRIAKEERLLDLLGDLPRIFADAGIRTVTAPAGHEADDVMATLAVRSPGLVALLSSDTDLIQVLSHRIFLCRPEKGERLKLGPAGVWTRYGVNPEQWTDYLALVGKPSNALAGVPGIGAKSASVLLQQFGDLETILMRPVKMKSGWRALLKGQEENALLCKRLSTLSTDLELNLGRPAERTRRLFLYGVTTGQSVPTVT